jgi:hypothetical protein
MLLVVVVAFVGIIYVVGVTGNDTMLNFVVVFINCLWIEILYSSCCASCVLISYVCDGTQPSMN